MADFGFVGPSYEAPSIYQDAQECINFFGEIDNQKAQGSRGYVALYPTPGLTKLLQPEIGEVRGLRTLSGGNYLLAVIGSNVYCIDKEYNATNVGTLSTSNGPVSITDNITSANGLTAYITDGFWRYAWIVGPGLTAQVNYNLSGNVMYVTSIPNGNLFIGTQIGSHGVIESYGSGTGGIGTYNLSYKTTAGTVTGITQTEKGTGFTVLPLVTVDSPSESYGTIAQVTAKSLTAVSCYDATIVNGGSGFIANQKLFVLGGTYTEQLTYLITSVSAGVITGLSPINTGAYSVFPTNPVSTIGTGSGATLTLSLNSAGSGYVVNDVLTAVGGVASKAASFKVLSVDGSGVIESVELVDGGSYTTIPTNPVIMSGGTGTNASFNLTYGVNNDFTITNPGTFYSLTPNLVFEGGFGASATGNIVKYISDKEELPAFTPVNYADGPWEGADVCDVVDNYIVYNQPNTQNWAATDLGSVISSNAYYGTKDSAPDPIVSIICDHRQVYLLGQQTTEVWVDVGNTFGGTIVSFPFQRVQGTMMQHGCAAPFSIARFSEQFMFVSKDNRGQAIIGAIQGYAFLRLSTHAVEQSLLNQDVSDAIAYTYQLEGHEFYVITFPSINLTWVYDLSTSTWHKWLSYDPVTGYYRHRSNCGAFFNNQYIVGDFENGKLYQVDNTNYTEDGTQIRRLRRAPHIVTDLQRQYFAEMQIQFQPGVGLQTGQGQDPQAMLRWSNDGGSTWSNEHWSTIGKVGRYKNRAIWRRLGWSRDRIFEVSMSDPVKTVIVSANLKAEEGDN